MILVGCASLFLAYRGIGRRQPGSAMEPKAPTFSIDDPEIADLPPSSTTRITQRFKLAREKHRSRHGAV